MLAGNPGSCIHHLGLDSCLDEYNYHDSLQACFIEGIGHLLFSHDLKVNNSREQQQFDFQCWIELQLHVASCKSQAINKDKSACHKRVMNLQVTRWSGELHLIIGSTNKC